MFARTRICGPNNLSFPVWWICIWKEDWTLHLVFVGITRMKKAWFFQTTIPRDLDCFKTDCQYLPINILENPEHPNSGWPTELDRYYPGHTKLPETQAFAPFRQLSRRQYVARESYGPPPYLGFLSEPTPTAVRWIITRAVVDCDLTARLGRGNGGWSYCTRAWWSDWEITRTG